jgi:hypothetical protein
MERMADRCALHFEMTSTLPPRATCALATPRIATAKRLRAGPPSLILFSLGFFTMRYFRFVFHAPQLVIVCLFLTVAHAEGGRVKVAILDGVPVYCWTAFRSVYRNDIDRALILRDFRRQGKTLPPHFIDEAIESKSRQTSVGIDASSSTR